MVNQHTCPRCMQLIAEIRRYQSPSVCDKCGFVLSPSEMLERKGEERSLITSGIAFAVIALIAIHHIGTWGSHCLEIIPLKIGQYSHTASAADMERMATIGMELRDYDLVETMYRNLSERVDNNNYLRLGKFQFSRGEFPQAVDTYRRYFTMHKNNLDARYDYARALAEAGMTDEAAKNFEYVLHAKPGVRQVTVIQKYVSMLVKAQRFDQAQRVIEQVRRQDPTASNFMDTEYKVISERKRAHG